MSNTSTCKPEPTFRYLPSSEKQFVKRNVPINAMPYIGDFVVFSVDPVASVAHLDEAAREAARQIRTYRHIGLVMMEKYSPMDDSPVNAFTFAFLRKGLPPTAPPDSFPELCIPVLPNVFHPRDYEPLRPIHPLPWEDCYISATNDLHTLTLRVKTTRRDYTPILPLEPEETWRLSCLIDDSEGVAEEKMRQIREGSLEAVAAIPLPESPLFPKHSYLPASPTIVDDVLPKVAEVATVHSSALSHEPGFVAADSTSTADGIDLNSSEGLAVHAPDDLDMSYLHDFEHFVNYECLEDPVVDIWYDLDMVKEVVDISLFMEECAQIKRIVDDAEERLGIRTAREAAAAERWQELRARVAAEEAELRSAHDSKFKAGFLGRLSGDYLHTWVHCDILTRFS
ncbi:hypothetical protein PENSPDRAFT_686164 [Peniophora sp. CONT]|nr:hypothetical protein PENSPDRAFT_686164 [Peniophora sp. CONT]